MQVDRHTWRMPMDLYTWGQLLTLSLMAIAVGMDAFSVGLGLGTIGLRLRQIAKIGIIFGIAHMLMPLVGIVFAHILSRYIGIFAAYVGGGLLFLLGTHMLYTAVFLEQGKREVPLSVLAIFIFALGVSIDALSIGFSLGLFSVNTWLTIALFGLAGMSMTWAGLLIGKHVGAALGTYGEALGGIVLIALGLKLMI